MECTTSVTSITKLSFNVLIKVKNMGFQKNHWNFIYYTWLILVTQIFTALNWSHFANFLLSVSILTVNMGAN